MNPSIATFDWKTGKWAAPGTFESRTLESGSPDSGIKVCIAGDWAPIRSFKNLIERSPDEIYGDLLPVLKAADLSIVNLEAPLSDRGTPVKKSGAVFKGEEKHIKGLISASFDAVTLANNHIFDYGLDAFQDTVAVLDRADIRHTGAGMNFEEASEPLVMDIKDTQVGIVNFSEGEDLTAAGSGPGVMGWDIETASEKIRALKETGAFVIAISHCGIEYIPFPPPYVVEAFRRMADAGADLVIGHHPHVPQGISFPKGVPVCHSLGNFLFYQETDLKYRKMGYMVEIGISNGSLSSFEIIPYKIHDQGLSRLNDPESAVFFKKLYDISLPLESSAGVIDSWNGFLDHYGVHGFENEISMILDKLKQDQPKGAAMFRNRLTTLQHHNHLRDLMTRIISNEMGNSPEWARLLAKEWLTARL